MPMKVSVPLPLIGVGQMSCWPHLMCPSFQRYWYYCYDYYCYYDYLRCCLTDPKNYYFFYCRHSIVGAAAAATAAAAVAGKMDETSTATTKSD